jgi:hypothetical protein
MEQALCVDPKLRDEGVMGMFNPGLNILFQRMAISQEN